ncbi:MAG: EamA family transporter [Actinobacteria bacterium]|jgi:drug/metabolite transporter (DMT)-like permease|nr:EamA family transporter [Actinomycetota bacterium]
MWIPITLAAATFQILRTSRQHRLRSVLSVNGAGFVRYAYGFPLALLAAIMTFAIARQPLPSIPAAFWPIIAGAGIAQILGTLALLRAFRLRDFAIGTVYAKTEVILVAIVSAVALGESLRPLGWVAAVICMVGVAWLAAPSRLGDILTSARDPAAIMGILAGVGFAFAAVGIRGAATTLENGSTWNRALFTLTVMLGIQTILNASQLFVTNRNELLNTGRAWRAALPVGILSLCGSVGWALAVTLTSAAKVRTLGQVELVMAFAISVWWLHERHTRAEYAASALVLIGIVGVIVVG